MILLDGKKLSQKILEELENEINNLGKKLRLAIVVVGEDPVVRRFIEQKKKAASLIGVEVRIFNFDKEITTNELRKRIAEIVHEQKNAGVIIQLPLPSQINTQYILNSIPPEKDVDALSSRSIGNFAVGKSVILPPVVGAVSELFKECGIDYKSKYTVVMGAGNLVGKPVAMWLTREGAAFSVVQEKTPNPQEFLKRADILISGIGKPKIITAEMVKDNVIVIDAGTSESEGKLTGDVDFDSVSKKASFITPVPGGVGPLTVSILFKNLVALAKQK